jgi:hypothetical protein
MCTHRDDNMDGGINDANDVILEEGGSRQWLALLLCLKNNECNVDIANMLLEHPSMLRQVRRGYVVPMMCMALYPSYSIKTMTLLLSLLSSRGGGGGREAMAPMEENWEGTQGGEESKGTKRPCTCYCRPQRTHCCLAAVYLLSRCLPPYTSMDDVPWFSVFSCMCMQESHSIAEFVILSQYYSAGSNWDKCSEKAARTFTNFYIGIVDFKHTGVRVSRNNTMFYGESIQEIFHSLASLYVCTFLYICVLGLQANLKETSIVKIACQVEATRIRRCSNKWYLWSKKEIMRLRKGLQNE